MTANSIIDQYNAAKTYGAAMNVLAAPVVHCDREVTTQGWGTNPCGVRLVSRGAACPNSDNHDMLSDGDCDAPRIGE